MGRQPLWRRVGFLPRVTLFKPSGVPMSSLEEVRLSVEEAEAIRLRDLEDLEQDAAAEQMNVSRPTYARILSQARQKVADALLNGKAIRIEGGNYELSRRSFRCGNGHEWELPFEKLIEQPPQACPTCQTEEIMSLWPAGYRHGGGGHHRGRR